MYELLTYSLKTGACLVVFYLFFKLLMSRETFHRLNRILLLGVVVLSFVLPLCVITVIRELPALPEMPAETMNYDLSVAPSPEPFPWERLAGGLFLIGAAMTLAWTLRSLIGVLRLIRGGRRERLDDGVVLVRMPQPITPFSWGRYIVVSEQDLAVSGAEIITHERAHLRLRHSLDLLVTDVAGCLQWFNPAMWLLRRELRAIHEFEADKAVLDSGVDARQYQLLLVKKAVGGRWYSVANSFNHSKLKIRIGMMLREKSSRWASAKALVVLPLTALALGAFAQTTYVFPEDKHQKKRVTVSVSGSDVSVRGVKGKPQIVVDGKEFSGGMNDLNPEQVASIRVVKDSTGLLEYGEKAKDGVIYVTSKKTVSANGNLNGKSVKVTFSGDGNAQLVMSEDGYSYTTGNANTKTENKPIMVTSTQTKDGTVVVRSSSSTGNGEAAVKLLYIVDGQEYSGNVNDIKPEDIGSVNVYKGGPVFDKYKDRDVEGVVHITTKRAAAQATEQTVKASLEAAEAGISAARAGLNSARQHMSDKEWQQAQVQLDQAAEQIKTARVEARSVAATAGESALRGKIQSISVEGAKDNSTTIVKGRVTANLSDISDKCLIFINGKKATKADAERISAKKIKRMNVFKGEDAIEKYGEQGRDGVIEIKTR